MLSPIFIMNDEEGNLKKLKEAFPYGCRVKLINPWASKPHAIYAEGIVKDYYGITDREPTLLIDWDDRKLNLDSVGYYFRFERIGLESEKHKPSEDYNTICPICKGPAYLGLVKIECPKGCK